MPRKVILYIATSLDGFIADENHGLHWLENFPHPEGEDYGYAELAARIDTTLMGRETFRFLEKHEGPFPYPDTKNYVFSRSLAGSPLPVEIIKENAPAFVAKLKQQPGKAIWLVGGGKLNATLANAGLIDEIILTQIPVFLGQGIPVFGGLEQALGLPNREWKMFKEGVVQIKMSMLN
jgi:dihydrofolate reductase